MLSRAAAGLIGDRAVFLLPGSPKAVSLAMEALILPEAGHLLAQARRSPAG
jgi:molybdenum cofactor biosynthesis protein B